MTRPASRRHRPGARRHQNALLDAKAKTLDVPCHVMLGGKVRDKIRVDRVHCVAYRMRTDTFSRRASSYIQGVRQIARDVRDDGYMALKTNIFHYMTEII